jgi:hypothetical protein
VWGSIVPFLASAHSVRATDQRWIPKKSIALACLRDDAGRLAVFHMEPVSTELGVAVAKFLQEGAARTGRAGDLQDAPSSSGVFCRLLTFGVASM